MIINDIQIELVLGEKWRRETFPMFVYVIRVNGQLREYEYKTVEEAKEAAEVFVRHEHTYLG